MQIKSIKIKFIPENWLPQCIKFPKIGEKQLRGVQWFEQHINCQLTHFPVSFQHKINYKNGFVDFEEGRSEEDSIFPLTCFAISSSKFGDQLIADDADFADSFEIFGLAHGSIPKSKSLLSFEVVEPIPVLGFPKISKIFKYRL